MICGIFVCSGWLLWSVMCCKIVILISLLNLIGIANRRNDLQKHITTRHSCLCVEFCLTAYYVCNIHESACA